MADFSEYTGPSEEWLALEPTLPAPPQDLSPTELRDSVNEGNEAAAAKEMVELGLQARVKTYNFNIPTRDGSSIEACSYRPLSLPASQPLPVYIHLHGGGFIFGTLRSEDANCSRIVTSLADTNSPVVVVNANYRHTPEHKYPTAWEDAEDAFHWVHDNLSKIGGDGDKVIVGGISAGAWLTASLTLAQNLGKEEALSRRPKIRGQVLMIPCLVHADCYAPQLKRIRDPSVSSYVQNEHAPLLPMKRKKFFVGLLEVDGKKRGEGDRRLNPGNASAEEVKGLPPTVLGVAGRDPLRDEGLLYGELLNQNGVPTSTNVFSGLPHGFRRYGDKLSESKRWDQVICEGIRWALSDPVATGQFEIKAQ
ncbi:hypothetical protein AJ80_04149 [Polytolypa hystricis UAMH7299]|uniref:Alpha/beta hydrolase fold-3 domain-containing protein n=1 Tax=Polytolypa hystricis (strain UAMH7299) TaxID=1447883 RepID=A0A2B7YDB1_POLH7|nr:hypothetical protein AJ80_04149 [Polytolypa hystricis UAMH7299]